MSKHKHDQSSEAMKPEDEQTQNQETAAQVPEVEEQPGAEKPQTDNASGAVETPETRLAAANAEIDQLKAQVADLNDKYLRTLAEQVNFRKRITKEKEEFQQYAVSSLLTDLIPVLDDFDRSLEAVSQNQSDPVKIVEGIQLIQKRLYDTLSNKYGLSKYETKGSAFNPNLHEAMFSDQGDVPEPMVTQEFMPGYKLHERIIRTAKVKVTMPANPTASAPQQTASDATASKDSLSTAASDDKAQ